MVGILRQHDVWGADAFEFRPERWFDATPDMEATLGLVFGAGKWACLGKSVAQIELNKVLVEVRSRSPPFSFPAIIVLNADYLSKILRRFELALVDPTRPWKSINCAVFLQSDFWVRGYFREDPVEKEGAQLEESKEVGTGG
jgi:hypothetical protein